MLVLTRRIGEEVCIDETIQVCVLDAGGGRVKLGFVAPREISIQRDDIRRKSEMKSVHVTEQPEQ
jgi:carbon storage regulator